MIRCQKNDPSVSVALSVENKHDKLENYTRGGNRLCNFSRIKLFGIFVSKFAATGLEVHRTTNFLSCVYAGLLLEQVCCS